VTPQQKKFYSMGGRGSGGHNRKPSKLKAVQGNAGKRKSNRREPKPARGVPEMPQQLKGEARLEWIRIAPILEKMEVLTRADGAALAAYCKLHALNRKAEAAIAKYGIVYAKVDEAGVSVLKKNPAVSIFESTSRLIRSFLQEFGLTPAARSKVAAIEGRDLEPDVKAQDQLQDFLDRKPVSARPQ
jgi:P27 family predicted phage terminase small subunit